jgi:hypothetical protein
MVVCGLFRIARSCSGRRNRVWGGEIRSWWSYVGVEGEKAISRSSSRSIILGKTSRIGLAARTVGESDTEGRERRYAQTACDVVVVPDI